MPVGGQVEAFGNLAKLVHIEHGEPKGPTYKRDRAG